MYALGHHWPNILKMQPLDLDHGLSEGTGPVLIRWPINRSNRFSDFLRLDRLDRFGKIIKSIFSKFWKREFQFFSDFQNFFGFSKFRENCFFLYKSKFSDWWSSVAVAYSSISLDVKRKVLISKSTITSWTSRNLVYQYVEVWKVLLRFTRTCTTYITFFDVKFEHSNLQGPFCELLSHTTSLYLMICVTSSYKKWRSGILWPQWGRCVQTMSCTCIWLTWCSMC